MPYSMRTGRTGSASRLEFALAITGPPITVMAWLRPVSSLEAYMTFWSIDDGNHEAYLCQYASNLTFGLDCNGATSNGWGTITMGAWSHLTTVWNLRGTNSLAYQDGVQLASADMANPAFNAALTLTVGDYDQANGGGYPADADYAALKVWDHALGESEINIERPWARAIKRQGLLLEVPMPTGWDLLEYPSGTRGPCGRSTRFEDWSGNLLVPTETGVIDCEPGPPIG